MQWAVLFVTLVLCAVAASLLVRHRRLVVELETQRKDLVDRNRELAHASDELERASFALSTAEAKVARSAQLAAVGELAAMVAHEVRNPLAIISNAVANLEKSEISQEDRKTLLGILREETTRLDHLVRDLLHYARPLRVTRVPIHLEEVLDRVRARLADSLTSDVVLETAPGDVVHGDPDLLRMVFDNLVDNALQAMHYSGRVVIRTKREMRGGVVGTTIDVVDTGDGMDTGVRDRAKDPFFTTRQTGTGLRLVIVECIVMAHGGALDLSSKSGEGTTVTLFFPHDTTDAAERLRPLMDSLMDSAPSSEDLRRK